MESKKKILLVDDEDFIRKLAKKILSSGGFETLQAENGTKAVETYKNMKDNISMVVLDIHMPDMSGFEVYRNLIRMNKKVKVLLCSGYLEDVVMENTKAFFIQKPFTVQSYLQAVKDVLTKSDEEVEDKNMYFYRTGVIYEL